MTMQDIAWQQVDTPDMDLWTADDWKQDAADLELDMEGEWVSELDILAWELACEARRESGIAFDDVPF